MLISTAGIVLKTVKFGETSLIVQLYTKELGRTSFIIHSVRKSKARYKSAMFQPLSLLDLEVQFRSNRALQRVKEVKWSATFTEIPFNIAKNTIAQFLTEVLDKTLKEQEKNEALFQFLHHSIELLDQYQAAVGNFHLVFLLQLTKWLGCQPQPNFSFGERAIFDLQEGKFTKQRPTHPYLLEMPLSEKWHQLSSISLLESHTIRLSKEQRWFLLQTLIKYYQLHVEGFKEVRSLEVLRTLFY